jgi:hypothetical protein
MYPTMDFLDLSEPETIEAGVLDAARCVDVCEETLSLLGKGDYLMGAPTTTIIVASPGDTKIEGVISLF